MHEIDHWINQDLVLVCCFRTTLRQHFLIFLSSPIFLNPIWLLNETNTQHSLCEILYSADQDLALFTLFHLNPANHFIRLSYVLPIYLMQDGCQNGYQMLRYTTCLVQIFYRILYNQISKEKSQQIKIMHASKFKKSFNILYFILDMTFQSFYGNS